MKRIARANKKWRWMVLLTSVFLIAFMAFYAFNNKDNVYAADAYLQNSDGQEIKGNYILRRHEDIFSVVSTGAGNAAYMEVTFSNNTKLAVKNTNLLQPVPGSGDLTYAGPVTRMELKALDMGDVNVTVRAYDAKGGTLLLEQNILITVAFSINEYISLDARDKAAIKKIFISDERSALILEPEQELCFGKNASEVSEQKYLNLTFGNASQIVSGGAMRAEWFSDNEDVVSVDYNMSDNGEVRGGVVAEGAGHTTLSVSWLDGTTTRQDTIDVYVRPKLTKGDENIGSNSNLGDVGGGSSLFEVENGDHIGVSVKIEKNQLDSVSDKITWVIAKSEGTDTILVRDSLGNYTEEFKDEANLQWIPSENSYRFDAKAGTYFVLFYVSGTYKSFEEAQKTPPGCSPVAIKNGVYVKSNYISKEITINIGGSLNLPDLFNITQATFQDYFVRNITANTVPSTGGALTPGDTGCISFQQGNYAITGIKEGKAVIEVTANDNVNSTQLRDIKPGAKVYITVIVTDTFSLNQSEIRLAEGASASLNAVYNADSNSMAKFEWGVGKESDEQYIKVEPTGAGGQYATVTALKQPKDSTDVPVVVLKRTLNGVTHTATCRVIIEEAQKNFKIIPSSIDAEPGETFLLTTNITKATKLIWMSDNENVATVVDSSTSSMPSAMLTAKAPGRATITAVNPANGAHAECFVVVNRFAESIDIYIGKKPYQVYYATTSEDFIRMTAVPSPKDCTETTFTWESTNKDVATVNENGEVTLAGNKEKGSFTDIIARGKGTASGTCRIYIDSTPIASILADVKELKMVRGETYDVKITYNPADPTSKELVWSSSDPNVAKVDNNGKITAVNPGNANIYARAKFPDGTNIAELNPPIKITVTEKLTSIDFESATKYISVGGKETVSVIFKPDKNVNTNLKFGSSDEKIFKIIETGTGSCVIQGMAEGQAILTCVSDELGPSYVKSCTIYVTPTEIEAKDFVITPAEETVYIGATLKLEKTFTPNNATNQNVTWSSSDSGIASVTSLGVVRGVKEGKVIISAVYTDTKNKVPLIRTSTINVKPAPINITDFDVTPDTQNIKVGDKFSLTPVFTPNNASNKNVDYQSLDEGVVTVSEKGEVTGVGAGDAIIQCQAEDGGFIATCLVHVDNAVEFSLSPATREIAVGRTFKLKKVIKPENAKKTAEWSTSNSSIATVDASGKVTAKRIGSCTITCTLTRYNQSAKCKVKVARLNSTVKLDKKNIRIGVGQTYRLKKTVWSNNTSLPKVSWKSSNKRVATVNSGGKITGKKVGLAKITVTTNDAIHAKATCKVRVIQRISSIKLSSDYLVCYVGRSKRLTAKCKPANSTITKLKWTSGDSSIARVTATGKVRALAEGNTYITATATDGSNKKARCFVKVLDAVPATSIVVAQSELTMQRGDSAKLTYKVLPDNTSDDLEFASDNQRVARVNKKGKVTAVGTGDATITILATSGASSTVDVNVVALNRTELVMRQYDTENLLVLGTSDTVTWYTSNARIVTVENGKVVGRAEGTAYIYAYVNGCRLSCRVTITSVNE